MAERPQNRCAQCEDTWYPRGRDLSKKCPTCGSDRVEIVPAPPMDMTLLYVLGVVFAFFFMAIAVNSC